MYDYDKSIFNGYLVPHFVHGQNSVEIPPIIDALGPARQETLMSAGRHRAGG